MCMTFLWKCQFCCRLFVVSSFKVYELEFLLFYSVGNPSESQFLITNISSLLTEIYRCYLSSPVISVLHANVFILQARRSKKEALQHAKMEEALRKARVHVTH